MERAKNEQRVILAYNSNTCCFDDQYSMLLWGKLTVDEFAELMNRVNQCTLQTSGQVKWLTTGKGFILAILALSFFILPGIMASLWKSRSYVSTVVLASGGLSGVAFFACTMLFIFLRKRVDMKTFGEVKRVLGEINSERRSMGLNWRLLDSQVIEIDSTYGSGTLGAHDTSPTRWTPKKWIEIEFNFTMPLFDYRMPVEMVAIQPKQEEYPL